MTLVVIQIQDTADGSADVRLTTEPPMITDKPEFTLAEKLGAEALNGIRLLLEEQKPKAPCRPKLLIVGADEMPL